MLHLATKDETSDILKSFITEVENLVDKKQNSVAKRRNRTLIEAARTMLADSKLPTTFLAEAVNTACYVHNRVLVVKPHNKTPYELFSGRIPALSFMRPFGCHVTILNTLDYLGKFDGKSDEGFFVGYSMNSKALKVYNIRTRKVEENLHIRFLEDKPIITGDGPKSLFDIDVLTKSMNYVPVVVGTNSNDLVGTEESIGAGHSSKETGSSQDYILIPLWKDGSLFDSSSKNASNDEPQPSSNAGKKDDEGVNKESGIDDQKRHENSTQDVNTAGLSINTSNTNVNTGSLNINIVSPTVTTAPLEATYADFFSFVVLPDGLKRHVLYGRLERMFMRLGMRLYLPILLDNGFQRGQIDKTLFTKRVKSDILLVQVYVDDIIFGSTKKKLCIEFETLMYKKFQMSSMGELTFFLGLQVTQKDDGIFISQGKYVDEILKKFGFSTVKTTSTPMETSKPLLKDAEAEDVDVHLYRSMIRSLMYLTTSRPDIMFVVCAYARFQVTPKVSHLHAVKRIFRYLKVTILASLDKKTTARGCQFLISRLISWQCKKQTIVANSATKEEYVAAASCCGQVLWIQNQMLDYGYNFMNTKIFIDNESTICIVKNLVFHSKTKHVEIRHHFIRDFNENKLM
ncbi:putative ribonuclease H-like domain-containing protein [Tanacetum coccineum]